MVHKYNINDSVYSAEDKYSLIWTIIEIDKEGSDLPYKIQNREEVYWVTEESLKRVLSNTNIDRINLRDTKIYITNKEDSIKIQKLAFTQGFRWLSGTKHPLYIEHKKVCLYLSKNKIITKSTGRNEFFNNRNHREITIEEIFGTGKDKRESRIGLQINNPQVRKEIDKSNIVPNVKVKSRIKLNV